MSFQEGPTPRVSVVLVTWNSAAVLPATLGALRPQEHLELVVVDNGSSDQSIRIVRELAPAARIIEQPHNLGFAAGCNLGLRATRGSYVLTLNDDAVLGDGYLHTLVAALEQRPDAASAVGKLVYRNGAGKQCIDSAGIVLRRRSLAPLDRGHGEVDRGQYDEPCDIFGPSAAAALYRRSALGGLGSPPLDEDLFAYYEDVDLAWRLGRKGWKHLYEPRAVAEHPRRGPDDKPAHIAARAFANRYLVWLKNESVWRFATYAPLAMSWEAARIGRRLFTRPQVLTGIPQAVRLTPRMLRKRREGP